MATNGIGELLIAIIFWAVIAIVVALILYAVVRAAVREGIKQALKDPDVLPTADMLMTQLRNKPERPTDGTAGPA